MPFTPTHVAAIVPIAWLMRWRVPLSALAIGSMICDLGVFFPTLFNYRVMHSLPGLVTHCLPFGLIAYFIFHGIVKRPLCALLPRFISLRLAPWANRGPSLSGLSLAIVGACLVAGASTHVLWDSFTHLGRWGVNTFPALNRIAIDYPQRPIHWYTVLQHGSSVIFLPPLVIGSCWWLLRQPIDANQPMIDLSPATKAIAITGAIAIPGGVYAYYVSRYPGAPQYVIIHESVRVACTLLIASGLFYACVFRIVFHDQPGIIGKESSS
jgi:hypothetical protein